MKFDTNLVQFGYGWSHDLQTEAFCVLAFIFEVVIQLFKLPCWSVDLCRRSIAVSVPRVYNLQLALCGADFEHEHAHKDQMVSQHRISFSVTLFGRFGRRGWLATPLQCTAGASSTRQLRWSNQLLRWQAAKIDEGAQNEGGAVSFFTSAGLNWLRVFRYFVCTIGAYKTWCLDSF